jgi:hypothetical protein
VVIFTECKALCGRKVSIVLCSRVRIVNPHLGCDLWFLFDWHVDRPERTVPTGVQRCVRHDMSQERRARKEQCMHIVSVVWNVHHRVGPMSQMKAILVYVLEAGMVIRRP